MLYSIHYVFYPFILLYIIHSKVKILQGNNSIFAFAWGLIKYFSQNRYLDIYKTFDYIDINIIA